MGIRNSELDNIDERIGQVLRNFRLQNNLSGQKLAHLVGMSQQQISRYERGKCHITIYMLLKILSALQLSTEAFFDQLARD